MMAALEHPKSTIPDFRPGDTVRVHMKVQEGDSERIQIFEGTVISRRGSGNSRSFTVRKISFGVGVERTFPLISPFIALLEVVRSSRVRRAKLYYLRALSGKAARLTEEEKRVASPGTMPKSEAPAPEKTPPPQSKTSSSPDGHAKANPDVRALASS